MEAPQKATDLTPEELVQRVAFLEAIIAENTSIISEKEDNISRLSAELQSERFKYAQLQRMIFGSKRERFVSSSLPGQMIIEFEPKTIEIEQAVAEERENIRIAYERKKNKKAHPGRLALPDHLPVIEITLEPEEDTTGMVRIGTEVTEELDYTPATLHINRTIRPKYMTKEDEKGCQRQVIAELNRPIHKCIASAALLAMIFTDKFIFHLPYYRIQQRMGQMGVPIPTSTFESWVKLGAELIKPLYAVHRLYVFSEIYQQIDESPIKVLDKDKPGTTHQGYMWVRYAPLSKSVLFQYYKG
jgi:transposase